MLSLKNKYHGRLQQIGRKESDWAEGVSPNAENAAEWLLKYENEHLYQ